MKIIDANIRRLFANIKLTFQKAFEGVKPQWEEVAMVVESTTKTEHYAWLGSFPSLQKWVGEKVIKKLKDHAYSITNDDYEATIEVMRNDLDDDQTGGIKIQAQNVGYSSAIWPDENIFPLLKNGHQALCYDGQYFFDTDHPVGDGETMTTVSNKSGSGSTAWYLLDTSRPMKPLIFQRRKKPVPVSLQKLDAETVFMTGRLLFGVEARGSFGYGLWQMAHKSEAALNADNFATALAAMRNIKNDQGQYLNINPTVIVVPPSLEATADALFNTKTLSGGGDNPNYGKVKVVVSPHVA